MATATQERAQKSRVPAPYKIPKGIKDIRAWKKLLVERFPKFEFNKEREISRKLAEDFEFLKWAADYYGEQYERVKLLIREQMEDAEIATYQGLPVATRRHIHKVSYVVNAHDEDALYPARKQG